MTKALSITAIVALALGVPPVFAQPSWQDIQRMTPEQQEEAGRRAARRVMEERRQRMERDPEFRAKQEAIQKEFEDRMKKAINEECERQGRLVECRMMGVPR